jgi:hypothetical protein
MADVVTNVMAGSSLTSELLLIMSGKSGVLMGKESAEYFYER